MCARNKQSRNRFSYGIVNINTVIPVGVVVKVEYPVI